MQSRNLCGGVCMRSLLICSLLSVVLMGCASLLPGNLAGDNGYRGNIEATRTIADLLREQYLKTVQNCGKPTVPAFLCSGVIFRTTTTSPDFDPWGHSDFSKVTGAVSFSYLRADSKMQATPWNLSNGFIFYPYLEAPSGKVKPEVACWYPLDGATYYRNAAGQLGCRDSIVVFPFPGVSRPCREQGITTAQQWIDHFNNPAGSAYPQAYSCSFMTTDGLGEEAAMGFWEGIRVRAILGNRAFSENNELRIRTWSESRPDLLPIEAFFYVGDGLSNARTDQQKYYNKSGGIFVPIVKMTLPANSGDSAHFSYSDSDQAINESPTENFEYLSVGSDFGRYMRFRYFDLSSGNNIVVDSASIPPYLTGKVLRLHDVTFEFGRYPRSIRFGYSVVSGDVTVSTVDDSGVELCCIKLRDGGPDWFSDSISNGKKIKSVRIKGRFLLDNFSLNF